MGITTDTEMLLPESRTIMKKAKSFMGRCVFASFVVALSHIQPSLALGEKAIPRAGDAAPGLRSLKIVQGSSATTVDWSSLRGKVVVLDFWATWCDPCLAQIPFLNELHEAFADEPVVFISISDEKASIVRRFLKETEMRGLIAVDEEGELFKSFGIRSRPSMVLVGRDGKIAGWTHISYLPKNSEMLRDLLAGKKPDKISTTPPQRTLPNLLGDVQEYPGTIGGNDDPLPLYLTLIRPAKETKRIPLAGGNGVSRYDNVTIKQAIALLYDVTEPFIIVTVPLKADKRYDVILRWPRVKRFIGQSLARQALEMTFGLQIRRDSRLMDVYVLSVSDGATPVLMPALSRVSFDEKTRKVAPTPELLERMLQGETFFVAMGGSSDLADNLSGTMGVPVVDEANIVGFYLFDFPYDFENPDPQAVIEVMNRKYNFRLTPAKRKVDVLVVEAE